MKITTGELVSIGTGKLCCPVTRLYELYNFLTGDSLFTHQLVRAFKVCEPYVQSRFPWLAKLEVGDCNRENWRAWLAEVEAVHGNAHDIDPLPHGIWQSEDPIAEAVRLFGAEKVIVVQQGEGGAS